MKKTSVPRSYWSYRWRKINGKRTYVKVKKIGGKEKIRIAKRRRKK